MEEEQVLPGGESSTEPSAFRLGKIGSRRRTTVSLTDLRTPLVENIMSMLPTGHDKAFKFALYNVVAMILAAVCIVACWAAYCILEPFIVPLLWALLCGSVIHPFKDRLVTFTRDWLSLVKASPTPLSLQLVVIPFRAIDSLSESIGTRVLTWWKYIGGGAVLFLLTYVVYHNPPVTLGLVLFWMAVSVFEAGLWTISWINGTVVLSFSVVYFVAAFLNFRKWQAEGLTGERIKCTNTIKTSEKTLAQSEDIHANPAGDQPDKDKSTKPPEDSLQSTEPTVQNTFDEWLVPTTAVVTWFTWFIYICELLPYPMLLLVGISIITGTAIYLRKQSGGYSIYGVTHHVALLLQLGDPNRSVHPSRGVSRKSSISQLRGVKHDRRQSASLLPSPQDETSDVAVLFNKASPSSSVTPGSIVKRAKPAPLDLRGFISAPKTGSAEALPSSSSDMIRLCPVEPGDLPLLSPLPSLYQESEDEVDGLLDSNKFIYGVLCACLVVQAWHHFRLVILLPIPVAYFGLKRLFILLGLPSYLDKTLRQPCIKFYQTPQGQGLFPRPVRILFHIIYEADRKFIAVFESYLDMIATVFILVAVMVFSVIVLIFAATQFYAEGDHLVRVGANVINSTVSQYPEMSQILPEGWESLTDSLVGNAYHYGRDYIKTLIRDSVAERNPEKAEEMEKQVIELWDRIYMSWNRTWGSFESNDDVGGGDKGIEWNDFVKTGQNVTHGFDYRTLVNYARSNFGQIRGILESAWSVLIGNVSLAVSAITSVLSVLFGGGSALLNLIISFIVFFTALFYLLSASTSIYKPVQLFNTWLPGDGNQASGFVSAIEESVNGVFSATLKMSAFYGLWTWLIHTLFQVNIVFVPSFFAAIFAAVPLLMPYWAVFPAVLELWLIQGHWTKALLMLLAQMAPMGVVDAQIYSEIKGGFHAYLTALAVAGGIYFCGIQGAIIGPVVLCFLFVAVKVGSNYMKEGTNFEFRPLRLRKEEVA